MPLLRSHSNSNYPSYEVRWSRKRVQREQAQFERAAEERIATEKRNQTNDKLAASKIKALHELGNRRADAFEVQAVRARDTTFDKGRLAIELARYPEKLTQAEKIALFTFADVLPRDEALAAAKEARAQPVVDKYLGSLNNMFDQYGMPAVLTTAARARQACLDTLNGTEVSPFANSLSWAIWGMAEQRYVHDHPEEAQAGDIHGDPMTDMVMMDKIVARQVAWEQAAGSGALSPLRVYAEASAQPPADPEFRAVS